MKYKCTDLIARWYDECKTITIQIPKQSFGPGFVNYQKRCTRLAAASDNVYQLLVHGRWFSPGSPASSTTKTGRHDIAGNIAESGVNHQNSNSNSLPKQS